MTKGKPEKPRRKPVLDASDFAKAEPRPEKKPFEKKPFEKKPLEKKSPEKPAAEVPPPEDEEEPEEAEDTEEDAADEEPAHEPAAGGRRDLGPLISSRKNARIHLVKALTERRGRKREGKFLIEGVKVIKELLARGVPIELVLWKEGLEQRPDAFALIGELRTRGIEAFGVAPGLFNELSDTETTQGLIAVAPMQWRPLEDLLGPEVKDADAAPPRAVVVAVGVQDPGNLGTILRSARFLGFAGVACLSGTTDPWAPKVVRASSGALIDTPPARVESLAELAEKAKAHGYKTVALAPRGGSALEKTTLPRRSLLLLGAEGPGLPANFLEGADQRVSLDASDPAAESLNAAMAFGVFAYAWRAAWAAPSPRA